MNPERNYVVVGAASGIGRATATLLATEGCEALVLADQDPSGLESLVNEVGAGRDDLMRKSMVLGVHTSQGIDRSAFMDKFGVDPVDYFSREVTTACDAGLMEIGDDAISPTELGYFFGDELSVSFYGPSIASELADLGTKYGRFFEQDRYA